MLFDLKTVTKLERALESVATMCDLITEILTEGRERRKQAHEFDLAAHEKYTPEGDERDLDYKHPDDPNG